VTSPPAPAPAPGSVRSVTSPSATRPAPPQPGAAAPAPASAPRPPGPAAGRASARNAALRRSLARRPEPPGRPHLPPAAGFAAGLVGQLNRHGIFHAAADGELLGRAQPDARAGPRLRVVLLGPPRPLVLSYGAAVQEGEHGPAGLGERALHLQAGQPAFVA